jgi:hypothetical protein
MPKYIDPYSVKEFLESKVSFGPSDIQISDGELFAMINQAETKVEIELSDQYVIPFQGYNGVIFSDIDNSSTVETIKNLCLYRAVMNVLRLYFGKTGENKGIEYINNIRDMYNEIMNPLKKKRNTGVFNVPPLPGLLLNGKSQRVSPVLPGPQLSGLCNANSFEYANKHMTDPRTNWLYGVRRGPRGRGCR